MQFRTEINLPSHPILDYKNPVLLLGSCFSENIGQKLAERKFDICINPFGILYQPAAIARSLERVLKKAFYRKEELFEYGGLWHSFDHHGRFSGPDAEIVIEEINRNIIEAHQKLASKDGVLAITWGTANGYVHNEMGIPVANCHKLPSRFFLKEMEQPKSIGEVWKPLMDQLKSFNPSLKIIFTISPVRHWKDGAVENQRSKSVLFVAMHRLIDEFQNTVYFPAYEILMDELRDYRFYAEDMLHPSAQAVDFVWERFKKSMITTESQSIISEVEKLLLAMKHRPLQPMSETFKPYYDQTKERVLAFIEKYQNIDPIVIGLKSDLELWKQQVKIATNEA